MSPTLTALVFVTLALAAVPALLVAVNLRLYRPPRHRCQPGCRVSVLVPARDEIATIDRCLDHLLAAAEGVDLEIVVLDDGSTDGTAERVAERATAEPRLRLAHGEPLPPGWCGKQHACWQLAQLASGEVWVFVDADVRLQPGALAALAGFVEEARADLVSGVPRQITGSLAESLLIPQILFILLGYLPIWQMRRSRSPAFAAGCGQIFVTTPEAYRKAGGHEAIASSLHDGLKLPATYRRAGLVTDLCDVTALAECRMYQGAKQVVAGLLKNATEGMAAPSRIGVFTLLLLGGQVAPLLLGAVALASGAVWPLLAGVLLVYLPRLALALRFRQDAVGVVLHPLAVAWLVGLQWLALARRQAGQTATWRGREYP